jgi:hypothetical protein
MTFTQSYATGPMARRIVRVRATIAQNGILSRQACLAPPFIANLRLDRTAIVR